VEPGGAGAAKTFDLAEFSAATQRFSEMGYQGSGGAGTELYSKEGDEAMASLMKDQNSSSLIGGLEDEDVRPTASKAGNEKGRNLLLQVTSCRCEMCTSWQESLVS
jgi:hypothetical protein